LIRLYISLRDSGLWGILYGIKEIPALMGLKIPGNGKAMVLIIGLGLGLVAFQGFALEKTEADHIRAVDMGGISSLAISYTTGHLTLLESDTSELLIKEYERENGSGYIGNIIRDGSSLSVVGTAVKPAASTDQTGVKIEVYIPRSYRGNCSVKLSSGSVTSKPDLALTNLSVELFSGHINLGRVWAEDINIKASNGDIKIHHAEGSIRLDAVSGSIFLESGGGEGTFRSSLGGITVGLEYVTGDLVFETGIGAITLSLPEDLSFNLDALTGTGTVRLNTSDQQYPLGNSGQAKMAIGPGPKYTIHSRTGVGNIIMNMDMPSQGEIR
jgi:hypothetical protein